ncbi:hypothetical protein OUZ56_004050 [Daphnia magna]|uniref:Uncharacterized protein n=1 Tax=Daphnia magna TaxID=35525 RepID=A0ABQ9YNL7_9CRUS|nr:hypothetical protein OUZ56_004050 [Daphnia magna]
MGKEKYGNLRAAVTVKCGGVLYRWPGWLSFTTGFLLPKTDDTPNKTSFRHSAGEKGESLSTFVVL